jgi:AAA domain
MFRWYQDATKCYVYLSDVSTSRNGTKVQSSSTTWEAAFRESRWFTRGWTLQELIAPTSVEFFSQEGNQLGCKRTLEQEIHEITKVPIEALRGGLLTNFEVEERFSWANHRETKRQEDKAYSLLGIFKIHMPLIYGEGSKAFVRLREAINGPFMIQEQKRQQHCIITNWISSIDFAAQQSDIISRRQEGTGVWFTDSPEFLSWVQGSNQTLFCPGIPGAGKTMIAAIAVDQLWKYLQNGDIGVAYIYCNYKTQANQTANYLAATLLKKLIQERPSVAEPVGSLYDRHAHRGTRPSLEEILNALQAVVSNYSKVYVVVDALDECLNHDRTQLLAMLRKLQSKGNLSLMATSRFIPEVVQNFNLSPMLEVRASTPDVKRFVAGQIYLLSGFVQRDSKLQNAIQDGISTAVDGM